MDANRCARLFRLLSAVALFLGCTLSSAASISWHEVIEVAAGRAERGPWRQNESHFDYVDDPAVAIDERGVVAVVWVEQARKDVFFTRFPPDQKQPTYPINVSRTPRTFSWLPRIAIDPKNSQRIFVLWQEIIFSGGSHGGDILFAFSEDGGVTFREPLNLSRSMGGDGKGRINADVWDNGSLDIAVGADGAVYAAWTEYAGPLWFTRSRDGAKFSQPMKISGEPEPKPARAPSLAADAERTVYLAWSAGESSRADIHFAVSTDGGVRFSTPRIISPSPAYSDAPKLAVDRGGGVHLVFGESAGGPFERHHIRYTQSRDGGRTFDPAREISSPLPEGAVAAGFPALSVDANAGVYVLYELYRSSRERPHGLGLSISRNGGRSFAPAILVPGSRDPNGGNGSQQGLLTRKLAVNAAGAMAVVNSSFEQNERSRVWLIRGRLEEEVVAR